jgi:enolase-phosphatase E1
MTSSLTTARVRHILLDIEGTTTPIAFVHEVLFSYARSQVRNYLAVHFDSDETQADIAQLREEHIADRKQNLEPPALAPHFAGAPRDAVIDSLVAYINWLMGQDRKSTGLKSLQGKIWRQGYRDGTLKAELFPDVAPALRGWHRDGLKISIFSSGSSLAQKLLFGHTDAGDLTEFIDNYFDTTTGSKTAMDSYRRIASALDVPEPQVLFISDVVAELDAASAAGLQTLLCVRPGNAPQSAARHQIIQSFGEISAL